MTISTSTNLQNNFLNISLKIDAPFLANLYPAYVALYYTDPTEDDIGTEISGSGYGRVYYGVNIYDLDGNYVSNERDLVFPTATGSWGSFEYYGIRGGPGAGIDSGNLLFFGHLGSPITVNEGESLLCVSGSMAITLYGAYRQTLAEVLLYRTLCLDRVPPAYEEPIELVGDKYIVLFTETPDDEKATDTDFSDYEVPNGDTGYSRQFISGSSWSTPSGGSCYNLETITFTNNAIEDWGDIRGVGITAPSLTSGVSCLLFSGSISASATVHKGDAFTIESGDLIVQLT